MIRWNWQLIKEDSVSRRVRRSGSSPVAEATKKRKREQTRVEFESGISYVVIVFIKSCWEWSWFCCILVPHLSFRILTLTSPYDIIFHVSLSLSLCSSSSWRGWAAGGLISGIT